MNCCNFRTCMASNPQRRFNDQRTLAKEWWKYQSHFRVHTLVDKPSERPVAYAALCFGSPFWHLVTAFERLRRLMVVPRASQPERLGRSLGEKFKPFFNNNGRVTYSYRIISLISPIFTWSYISTEKHRNHKKSLQKHVLRDLWSAARSRLGDRSDRAPLWSLLARHWAEELSWNCWVQRGSYYKDKGYDLRSNVMYGEETG